MVNILINNDYLHIDYTLFTLKLRLLKTAAAVGISYLYYFNNDYYTLF